jgi:hypothetical protein
MKSFNMNEIKIGPFPIPESVGSREELARAVRVRYYRTSCPAEVGKTIDPPDLARNIHKYSVICFDNRWPVVILRPESGRSTWGVVAMHPPRATLEIGVNPAKLIDKIYGETLARHEEAFNGCGFIHIKDRTYHMYQGLTLRAGEILAFHLADSLSLHMEEKSYA